MVLESNSDAFFEAQTPSGSFEQEPLFRCRLIGRTPDSGSGNPRSNRGDGGTFSGLTALQ